MLSRVKEQLIYAVRRLPFHNRFVSAIISGTKYICSPPGHYRRAYVDELLDKFKDVAGRSGRSKEELIKDLFFARSYYAIRDLDYFDFGIDLSKGPDKLQYVGWTELDQYYHELAKIGRQDLFDQKDKTYEVFRKFYKRDLRLISGKCDEKAFLDFFTDNRSGIIKPTDDKGGNGIQILTLSEQRTPEQLWDEASAHCPFILEELIVQAPEMSAFYPNSINTIRYTTFYHEGKLYKLQATLRMGRGGRFVDNITQGGIFAPVDLEIGQIKGPARSFLCESFERHPDTEAQIEGAYIPAWDELQKLVEEAVHVVPEQKLIGWDFAYSEKGWVMVEANWNPGLQCFDPDHGLRSLITDTLGKVVKMWDQ